MIDRHRGEDFLLPRFDGIVVSAPGEHHDVIHRAVGFGKFLVPLEVDRHIHLECRPGYAETVEVDHLGGGIVDDDVLVVVVGCRSHKAAAPLYIGGVGAGAEDLLDHQVVVADPLLFLLRSSESEAATEE